MTEQRVLRVIGPDGVRDVVATFPSLPPYWLSLDLGDGETVKAEDIDLYKALKQIRLQLEPMGLRICCQGARPNVHPSGMSAQMSGGRIAYVLRPDRKPTSDDLVNIFDPADCADITTTVEDDL